MLAAMLCTNLSSAQSYKKLVKKGNKFYQKEQFEEAASAYEKAYNSRPGDVKLSYKIGLSYLKSSSKDKALEYFISSYKIKPDISDEINYLLGQAYQFNHQFDLAIEQYEIYGQKRGKENLVAQKISECELGEELVNNPVDIRLENMGNIINTEYDDYAPMISADAKTLVFTSRRKGSTGDKKDKDKSYFEDIYKSTHQTDQWERPIGIGSPINTEFHDAAAALSPDGAEIFVYKDDNGGDIYVSKYDGEVWSEIEKLPESINSPYWEPSISVTADKKTYYFSSNRPGGLGGLDLYMCTQNDDGSWGIAKNLGPNINTVFDEDAPFIHPDGKALYFSSMGHIGMGEYDIFKSELIDNEWQTPRNMGFPINTAKDDSYFVISQDYKLGFYSSSKEGGVGKSDIYAIYMEEKPFDYDSAGTFVKHPLTPEKMSSIAVNPVVKEKKKGTVFQGKVLDAASGSPIEARVLLVNNEKNYVIGEGLSNSQTGRFRIEIPISKNVGLVVEKEEYLFHSRNFGFAQMLKNKIINTEVALEKLAPGSTTVLKNIFFDTNKSNIRTQSISELDRIKNLLLKSPEIKIRVNGHTDNVGNKSYNKNLSKKRAKAVVEYLISHGVNHNQLSYKGFGEEKPLVSNDDEKDGRELNRRTEIEIVGNL